MTSLETLRQRQGEILKMIAALRGLLKPDQLSVAPIAQVTHTLLCDLCTRMREHFEEEEKRLYPTMLAHGPQELRNLSWSFLAGDVALRELFGDYARRWLKDCQFSSPRRPTRRRPGASWSASAPQPRASSSSAGRPTAAGPATSGLICVRREHPEPEVAVARFRFNGWAKYPDHRKDDQVAERAAKALGVHLRHAVHKGRPVVLEGGAVDVDGKGTILTTEECLLDPFVQVRNPGFKLADYEKVFLENLGATHAVWLGRGITGDDTHGHVDDLCRFVSAKTIVLCREKDPKDPNHRVEREAVSPLIPGSVFVMTGSMNAGRSMLIALPL